MVLSVSDLDGVDTESSGDVDGRSHEVQSQVDAAAAAARRLVQQLATRRRLLLRVLRYLVAAEVKHAQRLDVLPAARAPRQAQRAMHAGAQCNSEVESQPVLVGFRR